MNELHKFMLNSNIIEFTNDHLDINKDFYNIERKPEYFSFDDMGLSYQGTYLFSNKRIQNAIIHDSNNQLFRQTRNSKIPGMKHDIKERGIDIREKPLQIVCTKGENMEDVRVEHLFNGNSFNEALYGAAPDLENRMCAVYFKNANFTLANLIQVGAFLNTLDYQSEPLNDASLAVILKRMMEDESSVYALKPNPTNKELSKWKKEVEKAVVFMMGITEEQVQQSKYTKIIEDVLNEKSVYIPYISISNAEQVVEQLRKFGYHDNIVNGYDGVKWASYGSNWKGMLSSDMKAYDEDPTFYNSGGVLKRVIHCGKPDMKNPLYDFCKKLVVDWKQEWDKFEDFVKPDRKGMHVEIVGVFQQLDILEEKTGFKKGDIMPFDALKHFWKNNYEAICNGDYSKIPNHGDKKKVKLSKLEEKFAA